MPCSLPIQLRYALQQFAAMTDMGPDKTHYLQEPPFVHAVAHSLSTPVLPDTRHILTMQMCVCLYPVWKLSNTLLQLYLVVALS